MDRRTVSLAILGSLASAIAVMAVPAAADEAKEKCFGVALKGQNDCAAGAHSCAGSSTIDYDGQSFKVVPKGTCTSMKTSKGMGMLEPSKS